MNSRNGKTDLFRSLQRLCRRAAVHSSENPNLLEEMVQEAESKALSRRNFLRVAVGVGATLVARRLPILNADSGSAKGKVVVVGAGLAGLSAAYTLKNSGITAEIYEGTNRTSGRMMSAHDLAAPGLITELGGEFIDSDHADMRRLAQEMGLELYDKDAPGEPNLPNAYFFGNKLYSERQVLEGVQPALKRMKADFDSLPEIIDHQNPGNAVELDRTPLSQYLRKIGLSGWLYDLLNVAYSTEFGIDSENQSALNLICLLPTADHHERLELFGKSDERFKVKGGNQRIPDEIAKRLEGQIHFERRLESVRMRGSSIALSFRGTNGAVEEVTCDFAVLCLPFTLLREVEIKMDLPAVKKKAIAELGYGTNSKLILGYQRRLWKEQKLNGEVYSDLSFQMGWDSSRFQPGTAGSLTFLLGGKRGLEIGTGSVADHASKASAELDKVFKGSLAQRNGKQARFFWPGHPFTKGSYASYLPGQWTSIAGAEGMPVGNLYFAGSDCSYDFQGFMNGAAETGRKTAEAIAAKMLTKK